MENLNNSSSKTLYTDFLDKLVADNIITQFCKNNLVDMLNSTNNKLNYQFKKHFNNLLELSDVIQA